MISTEKPGTPTELVHHGVKGMKWGVRKAYTERRTKESESFRRYGDKTGTGKDKARVYLGKHGLSAAEIALAGGAKNAALKRADKIDAHVARINNGQAHVLDKLHMYGNVRVSDLAKGYKNRNG